MFSIAIELGGANSYQHYRPLPVTASLRGNAESCQLHVPPKGKLVSITGLAASFCPTGRDVYLEKKLKIYTPSWERSVLGHVVDAVLVNLHEQGLEVIDDCFEEATVAGTRPDLDSLRARLLEVGRDVVDTALDRWEYKGPEQPLKALRLADFANHLDPANGAELYDRTQSALIDLVEREVEHLCSYLSQRRRLTRLFFAEDWMAEIRATLTRLQTGLKLDLSNEDLKAFGISPGVRPDFVYAVTLIGDLKTGEYHASYEDVATGYAIFAERVLKRRINAAAILSIALDLDVGRVRTHRTYLVKPDTAKRQLWLTKRDFARSVMNGDAIPNHPQDLSHCNRCPYLTSCWSGGTPGTNPANPPMPSRSGP